MGNVYLPEVRLKMSFILFKSPDWADKNLRLASSSLNKVSFLKSSKLSGISFIGLIFGDELPALLIVVANS